MLADLVSDPARAAVVAERRAALEAKVAAAVVRSRAPATLRAYRSDWKDFALLCEQLGVDALPAAPAVVAGYVAELADPPDDRSPARVSTITRRLAAIGEGHKVSGHPNPCTDPLVRETMKGVRQALGVAPHPQEGDHHRRHQRPAERTINRQGPELQTLVVYQRPSGGV